MHATHLIIYNTFDKLKAAGTPDIFEVVETPDMMT